MADDSPQKRRAPGGTVIRERSDGGRAEKTVDRPGARDLPTVELGPGGGEPKPTVRADPVLPVVPRSNYRVQGEFARGGLGRILRAEDLRLNRIVALKELHFEHPAADARFIREVLVTARLQHPNIVPVHEAGRWSSGEPFYAMKLVEGRSLSEAISDCEDFRGRLDLVPAVLSVIEAMAYAHSQRIIHRDLKPANVLVGAFGETVVIDWGLAKDLGESGQQEVEAWPDVPGVVDDGVHTAAGAVMGTPAYMPPEQAAGEAVDETADVYALGAILYQVICGARPYGASRGGGILDRVRAGPPPALEGLVPDAPADLVAIADKAMGRHPDARYRDAGEMADELRRYITGGLVGAYEYSTWELLLRFVRRQRTAVVTGILAMVALMAFGAVGIERIARERDRAEHNAREAGARADLLVVEKARSLVDSDPTRSVAWLKTLERVVPGAISVAAQAEYAGVAQRLLRGHRDRVASVAFSPDGSTVLSASFDKTLRLWTREGVQELAGHRERVTGARWSPDGSRIASGGYDAMVRLWRPDSREAIVLAGHEGVVRAVEFSPDGAHLASVGDDGVRLWSTTPGAVDEASRLLAGAGAGGTMLRFSPGGEYLAVAGAGTVITVYFVSTGRAITLEGHGGEVRGINFIGASDSHSLIRWADLISVAADGSVWRWPIVDPGAGDRGPAKQLSMLTTPATSLAVGHTDGSWAIFVGTLRGYVYRIDPNSGAVELLLQHVGRVSRVRVSPDGRMLASAGWDKSVRLLHLSTGAQRVLLGHSDAVTTVAFSADGRQLVSGSSDKTARIWPTRRPLEDRYRTLAGDPNGVHAVAFSPDGDWIAAGGHSNTVRLWRLDGTGARVFTGHADHVFRVRFSPDGRWLASSSDDRTVRLWPVHGGPGHVLRGHGADVEEIEFSADGRLLASAAEDNTARLWRLTGLLEHSLEASDAVADIAPAAVLPHDNYVTAVRFDREGRRLLTGSRDHMARLWDTATGRLLHTLLGHTDEVRDAAFSPSNALIATAGADDTVRLWAVDGREQGALPAHLAGAERLAFSPDGHHLAVSGLAPLLWLCEVPSGPCLQLVGHRARVHAMKWSADGRALVTSGGEGWVIVWDPVTGERRVLSGHAVAVYDVDVSSDGASILSGCGDGTVRLWPLVAPMAPQSLADVLEGLSAQPAHDVISDGLNWRTMGGLD